MPETPRSDSLNVTFGPDWSQSVPYQSQLVGALSSYGVDVDYLQNHRRGLPLWRGLRNFNSDLFHLHWPEKYYQYGQHFMNLRRLRFPLDLYLASRPRPLLLTAHNLLPHDKNHTFMRERNARVAYQLARRVFVHSKHAGQLISERFNISPEKIVPIPFGDLAPPLGPPRPKDGARSELNLDPEEPIALIFGALRPYKGIDEVVDWWRDRPELPHLYVVGWGSSDAYVGTLEKRAEGRRNITIRASSWLPEPELNAWLSAADVCICNHSRVFSSGGASLARSWGLPLLMPANAQAVDLAEPDPRVMRFDKIGDAFASLLENLLTVAPDYASAAPWREATSWDRVAEITAATYREVLSEVASV